MWPAACARFLFGLELGKASGLKVGWNRLIRLIGPICIVRVLFMVYCVSWILNICVMCNAPIAAAALGSAGGPGCATGFSRWSRLCHLPVSVCTSGCAVAVLTLSCLAVGCKVRLLYSNILMQAFACHVPLRVVGNSTQRTEAHVAFAQPLNFVQPLAGIGGPGSRVKSPRPCHVAQLCRRFTSTRRDSNYTNITWGLVFLQIRPVLLPETFKAEVLISINATAEVKVPLLDWQMTPMEVSLVACTVAGSSATTWLSLSARDLSTKAIDLDLSGSTLKTSDPADPYARECRSLCS